MKLHLPKQLFASVLAVLAASYAVEEPVSFDNSVSGVANVTVNGGDLSGYYMYGTYDTNPCAVGTIGAASGWDHDGNAPMEKFQSATVTMNGGTGLQYLSGYGVPGNAFEGDVTVNMNGGETDFIVGGTYFASGVNRDRDVLGSDPGYGHESFGYKSNYGQESNAEAPKQNININVTGGSVGQIRGGHSGHSNSNIYTVYLSDNVIPAGEEAIAKFMESNPAAVSGDVNINVSGGTVSIFDNAKETAAIQGAGGSGFSVDGTVRVTVSDDADIEGDIIAGSSNVYTFTGATEVTIAGGSIDGNVYAGGDGSGSPKIAGGPAPTVKGSTKVTLSGGSVINSGSVFAAGLNDVVKGGTSVTISGEGTKVDGYVYGGGIDSEVTGSRTLTVDSTYTGEQSYRVADFTAIQVDADVTFDGLKDAEEGTTVSIADDVTLTLTDEAPQPEIGEVPLTEADDVPQPEAGEKDVKTATHVKGGTLYIDGAQFKLAEGGSLDSKVVLDNHATLDLNGAETACDIVVYGCTLAGACNYTGNLYVDGGDLDLTEDTCAGSVTVTGNGSISGHSITADAITLNNNGDTEMNTNVIIRDGGTITLIGNSVLNVQGDLTLGSGTSFVLEGDYQPGDEIIRVNGEINQTEDVVLTFGDVRVIVSNGSVTLVSLFDRDIANAYTISNWGMATASRSFVNTVRGQRTNTGCIANGRGTAWVAVLGGNHDIDGSDISLKGAAVGADMKVGEKSSVGIAFGYVEGDIRPSGLRSADQEGTYVALYGEHGLRKLSATSCLSLDWVATYGQTDTEWDGADWEQQSLQLNSRLNWNKKVNDRLCVSVFGGLEYYTNESDTVGNTKTGSIQNLRGEIGVGARYVAWGTPAVTDGKSGLVLARGCEKLVLNGEIRYMNDMVRSNPVIEQDGLRGKGDANPGRQGVGIEAGATYRIGERWSASANYGFNTMEDSREHRVNVGASYTF
ncbi:MAG: autotransporter domain-containing protein [Akkermansia sp.]|nr:autotransporter domain-containing protein [Akkermansia sp.]